jgi:CRP/FNR family transcriptional regulator, cyclic AMP receptor protein
VEDREEVGAVSDWRAVSGDALRGIELFSRLDPEVRRRLAATAVPHLYREGQIVFREGDPGDALLVVRRGAVAVFRTGPSGDRAVLTVVRAPGVLGEVALLDGETRSASVEAIRDSLILSLSRSLFLELVHSDHQLLDEVCRALGAMVRRLTEQKADHVFLDLPGRVAKTLIRLVSGTGPEISLDLSQSRVAELVGGSRQSVNQVIRTFANRGWLRTHGRQIVLTDLPALRHRAGLPVAESDGVARVR